MKVKRKRGNSNPRASKPKPGKLPDVPVLQKLTESIDTATQSLNELRDEKLASMAVVGEIDADGPSATGSTEPAPMT